MTLSKTQNILSWVLQIIVAAILFQTLFFKFTGAAESVYIFSKLGLEPWGRIGSGVVELIAVILLLIPSTVTVGAILALGTISGAIMSHLTKLGVVVINSDGTSDGRASSTARNTARATATTSKPPAAIRPVGLSER